MHALPPSPTLPLTRAPRSRTEVMNRFEVKYLVATRSVPGLVEEFAAYTRPDPHAGPQGYPVYSIYWDTPDFRFFWEKVEGLKYRRKLRFRRYGTGDLYVEVKQREDRTLHKRRLRLSVERAQAMFGDGTRGLDWAAVSADPVATEVALLIERLGLRPRMAVTYRRRALFGRFAPELRITFDSRIQCDRDHTDLARPFALGRYVLDPRATVLEVKYDHRAPRWLTKAACRHGLTIVRMSKYCSAVDRCWYGGQIT